jgi:hypothetical protein
MVDAPDVGFHFDNPFSVRKLSERGEVPHCGKTVMCTVAAD